MCASIEYGIYIQAQILLISLLHASPKVRS
jgi:hypothetical protein